MLEQAGSQCLGPLLQHAIGDVLRAFIFAIKRDVHPFAMLCDMPVQHLDQRGYGFRRMVGLCLDELK